MDIERLKTAKTKQNITYDELSAKSGVPVSTIYDLFRGVTTAPRSHLGAFLLQLLVVFCNCILSQLQVVVKCFLEYFTTFFR